MRPPEVAASARVARIDGFREDTREHRMRIAQEAGIGSAGASRGASHDDLRKLFTTVSVPAVARLHLDEREVLDTLVEGASRVRAATRSRGACDWSRRSRTSG